MEKQTPEEMVDKARQILACSVGDQIIDEMDKIYMDESHSREEKIHRITRLKNEFKLAQSRIVDGVGSIRYKDEIYPFPDWKIDNIVTYSEGRLEELKNPPAIKYRKRAYGVALILARREGLIPLSRWYQKDLRDIAGKVFDDIGEPHHAVRVALDNSNKLPKIKLDHPEDYENGEKLYSSYRSKISELLPID